MYLTSFCIDESSDWNLWASQMRLKIEGTMIVWCRVGSKKPGLQEICEERDIRVKQERMGKGARPGISVLEKGTSWGLKRLERMGEETEAERIKWNRNNMVKKKEVKCLKGSRRVKEKKRKEETWFQKQEEKERCCESWTKWGTVGDRQSYCVTEQNRKVFIPLRAELNKQLCREEQQTIL